VVVKAPQTYFNSKFEEKETLREQHVLWEMDREKTYFRSAMDKINPQQILKQQETEKLRRTNMMMSLNHNVMDKTTTHPEGFSKAASHSFKKLPTALSSKKDNYQGDEDPEDERPALTPAYKSHNSSVGGPNNGAMSPSKLMSMTMPKGFLSPKSHKKGGDMNKKEIKDVVKSYFDRG
jgi:hypothetical protein